MTERIPGNFYQPKLRKNISSIFFKFIAAVILSAFHNASFSQSAPYNRFQYHRYQWQVLHTEAFHIYFPAGYDSLCAFTAREVPGITALLKQRLFTGIEKDINIILYPSTDQLYETNIGAHDARNYTLPTVVLKGNRIVVAYDGSYERLKTHLSEALARSIWEEQFDNGIEEQLKSTVLNDKIPLWCKEGMIRYFSGGWSIEQEDQLRRTFEEKKFSDWYEVLNYQPRLLGTAFCYYLTRQYYPQAAAQLYQQLKKKKDLHRAIRLVTKKDLPQTLSDCYQFYNLRFQRDSNTILALPDTISIASKHPRGIVKTMEISADGTYIAYVLHQNKQRTVYISHVSSGKIIRLATYQLPPWYTDLGSDRYPLIKWKEDKQELWVAYPEKGKTMLRAFSPAGNKLTERVLKPVDGITALNNYDGNSLLLTAYRKGQSDVILYDLRKERYKAMTNDRYDDHEPVFDKGTGDVIFSSERQLKRPNYDPIQDKDSLYGVQGLFSTKELKQPIVSDTVPYITWKRPLLLSDGSLLATQTTKGRERFALITPSGNSKTLDDYRPYSYSQQTDKLYFYTSSPDSIYLSSIQAAEWTKQERQQGDTASPWLKDYIADAAKRAEEDSILKAAKANSGPGFLEGVLKPKNSKELAQRRRDSIYQSVQYDADKVAPYVLQLHSAYFTAKVNNDYFINRYQPYINYQGQFKFPEVGGMVQGGFTDLFENHHFNIGYRLPAGTEGSDFFVYYQNTKKRTDWGIKYFRKVESLQPDPQRDWQDENGNPYPNTAKVKTHYYELSFHHPLSYYTAIDFTTALRKDRTIFLATEKYSLGFAPLKSVWSINTLSYTYNKLTPTLPMLYKGFSGKALLDVFAGIQGLANDAVYGGGIDLQYHQPLYKYITAVASLKAGHSGGQQKILYNMGGVDHNLTVRTDTSVHFNQNAPYAFQTLITPLRGFQQNSLYGNQYTLLNVDVYFPLFQTLIPIETNFSSINNLQLGLFSDMAYARETWQANAAGRSKVAYGFSVRTLLAGYFIRADLALPNDSNRKLGWYLSVGF